MPDIQAQLADGTILNFPEGTTDDVVNNAVRQHIQSGAQPVQAVDPDIPRIENEFAPTPPAPEITGGEIAESLGEPFEQEFGIPQETKRNIYRRLTPFGQTVFAPFIETGDLGVSALQGLDAAVQSGAKGVAGLLTKAGFTGGRPRTKRTQDKFTRELKEFSDVAMTFLGLRIKPAAFAPSGALREQLKPLSRKEIIKAAPQSAELKETAKALYDDVDRLGVKFKPKAITNLGERVARTLREQGLDSDLHPQATAALNRLNRLTEVGEPISYKDLNIARRVASSASTAMGNPDNNRLARMIVDGIDDFVSTAGKRAVSGAGKSKEASQKHKQANDLWRRVRKSEMLDDAFAKADLQGSGFENGIRVQFRSILNNKNKAKQFTKEEKAAMRKVVKGGKIDNALRVLGSFGVGLGPQKSPLTTLAGIGGGGLVAGVPGSIGVPLLGQAAKLGAQARTKSNAEFAKSLVLLGATKRDASRGTGLFREFEKLPGVTPEQAANIAILSVLGATTTRQQENEVNQ